MRKPMMNYLKQLLLLCMVSMTMVSMTMGQGVTDLTRVPGSSGEAVVKSSVALILESCVFSNDFLFLRRLAHVISTNGEEPGTYRDGFHGGIWQISQAHYDLTKNVASIDYTDLNNAFNVVWEDTTWEDLRKPLYSGIAAMITLKRFGDIPKSLDDQAMLYKTHFSGDDNEFRRLHGSAVSSGCGNRAVDVAFVLDSSQSISDSDFEKSKKFAAEIAKGFKLGPDAFRVAVTSFSSSVREHIMFKNNDNLTDAITGITKYSGGTNTYRALDNLRTTVFTEEGGSRKNAARIAIVQTDGKSRSESSTIEAASKLKDEGVIVFAIGIGSGIRVSELEGIATPPTCTHVRYLDDFTELNSILADIEDTTCTAEIVTDKNTTSIIGCDVPQTIRIDVGNETSIITYPTAGTLGIYGSFLTTKPSEAFADFATNSYDGKPSIIYVANSNKTLYLSTVSNSEDKCESTFRFETVPSNSLRKTGASNLCIKNGKLAQCSDIDFVKSGNYADSPAVICRDKSSGYHQHPDTKTKYIYCSTDGSAYVVNCTKGFAYVPSQEDCAAPADLSNACAVCTTRNWEIGLRRFMVLGQPMKYVQCNGSMSCTVESCWTYFDISNQMCPEKVNKEANAATAMMSSNLAVFGLLSLVYITSLCR